MGCFGGRGPANLGLVHCGGGIAGRGFKPRRHPRRQVRHSSLVRRSLNRHGRSCWRSPGPALPPPGDVGGRCSAPRALGLDVVGPGEVWPDRVAWFDGTIYQLFHVILLTCPL